MRLYDLSEQYNDLVAMLEEDADNESLQTMLNGLNDAFETKVESIVKLIRSKEAEQQAIKTESERLNARASRLGKDVEWLEDYIKSQMIATNREKVKSALFSITLRTNPPAVNVLDEKQIPNQFFVTKPAMASLDKGALLEKLRAGEKIPGAAIIQRQSLQIK